jgi:hypothetical protein
MALIHEKLSDQFYDWEMRGRGWDVFPEPVRPEPPFRPFEGHVIKDAAVVDDGRRPTFLSSLVQKFAGRGQSPPSPDPDASLEEEPEPETFEHSDPVELRTTLPAKLNISRETCAEFLANLSQCRNPIAFEIVGSREEVSLQFVVDREDASIVRQQLEAHFPEGTFLEAEGVLQNEWLESPHEEALVVEFGLEREFMFQLRTEKADPFVGIVGSLSQLGDGEIAVFQVLFEPVRNNWKESIEYSVCHADGKPFFVNATELAAAGKWKTLHQLYAAVVRIGILSESFDRTLAIARNLAGSFQVFANPQGNELIPLKNDEYPFEAHVEDLLHRNSRRSGMILTSEELVGFVHLPSAAVRSPAFVRDSVKSKAAPASVRSDVGIILGENRHGRETIEVHLTPEQRVRHMHVIGASGTGKSTLLFNLIRQDIENGQGIALLDPHGDLVDRILTIIPEERIGDVILVDPSDEEYSIGFNILSAHTDLEKTLLASDLISVFQRLSTSWGDQMGSVLQNAILAFLESDAGGTLADMRRFLIEPAFREKFLKTVRDPDIVYYWRKGFTQLSGNKSIGSVLTRLETFLAPKPIRYMVSQKENRLDFGEIMDRGKIFLAKLPQGKMGKENSFLLGSFFVSKFQQTAMSRQDKEIANRRDFWLYLDEFHNFITPSMAEILSGARKYRLGLILAHQELRQLERDRDVASAVLSNCFSRIIFRVGDSDAKNLADGLSFFEAADLQNLETGKAVCRVERSGGDFNLSIPISSDATKDEAEDCRRKCVEASRNRYATARADVEAMLRAKFENDERGPSSPVSTPPSKSKAQAAPALAFETQELAPSKTSVGESANTKDETEEDQVQKVPPPISKAPVISNEAREAVEQLKVPPQAPVDLKKPKIPTREQGQGGERHKLIQKRIKEAAELLGFRSSIEGPISGSEKRFDVLLERNDLTIACEISFSTTIDHEIGNVLKCLRAGVSQVAVISPEKVRLSKIKEAVTGTFSAEEAARIGYFEPNEFFSHLQSLGATPEKKEKRPTKHKGWTVKSTVSNLSPEEQAERDREIHRVISDALRAKKK